MELAAERVVALNANESFLVGAAGLFLCHFGRCERGLALLDRAKKLTPHHVWWMHMAPASYHFDRREYEDALLALNKIEVPSPWKLVLHAAALAQLGRVEEANEIVRKLLEVAPDYPVTMREELTFWNQSEAYIDHLEEGLRKAGIESFEAPAETQ